MEENQARFTMIKKRHTQTLENAIQKKLIDPQVKNLSKFISNTKNFFTSSTCSGRIVLLNTNKQETKKEASFHAKWHRQIRFEEIWKALCKKTSNELWFKMEPFILHIGTNNTENANTLLKTIKTTGIKRGGIQVLKPGKIIIEITGTQYISCPIKKTNKILLEKKYIKTLIKKANKKLQKNYALLKKLETELKQNLK